MPKNPDQPKPEDFIFSTDTLSASDFSAPTEIETSKPADPVIEARPQPSVSKTNLSRPVAPEATAPATAPETETTETLEKKKQQATAEFLDYFGKYLGSEKTKINVIEEKKRNKFQKRRLKLLDASSEEAGRALDLLEQKSDASEGTRFIEELIGERAGDDKVVGFAQLDEKICDYIGNILKTGVPKEKIGLFKIYLSATEKKADKEGKKRVQSILKTIASLSAEFDKSNVATTEATTPGLSETAKPVEPEDPVARIAREAREHFSRTNPVKPSAEVMPTPEADVPPAPGEINPEAKKKIEQDAAEAKKKKEAEVAAPATEAPPEVKTEEEEDPLAETVGAEIENITGKIEAIEISDSSKQVILDFLTEDAREGYKMFALEWFRDHEDEIREMVEERRGVMRDDNDWKVKTVLGAKDVGGMGVLTNEKGKVKSISKIENGRYAKYGEVLDKIGILKIDIKRDPIPPETPYLLLNYLQKSLEGENQKIEVLIMEAVPGDKSAEAEISAVKEQLKKLYLARKEIADKLLRKDLTQLAEEKIVKEPGFKTKEQQIEEIRKEKEQESHAKLMDEEWAWFCGLPLAQKAKLWEQAVEELPVDAKISPILPPETEENKQKFVQGILAMAAERGVTDPNVFYGLLEQGYKPYFVAKKPKLRRFFITDVPVPVVIPNKDSKKDYKSKDEDEGMAFIKKVGEDYSSAIKAWAETFGGQIEEEHNRKVREEVEEEIYKLANSPVVAVANARGYFEKRRKVLLEEAKKRSVEPKK